MTEKELTQEAIVSFDELMMWRSALANCAIEGNQYAKEQLALWDTDRDAFIAEYLYQREVKKWQKNKIVVQPKP